MNTLPVLATLNLMLGGLVFLLGLLILRENPRQRLNRVVSVMLFFGGFGSLLTALGLMVSRGADTSAEQAPQQFAYLWEFFFPSLFLFACIFPRERAFTRPGEGLQKLVPFAPRFEVLVYLPHAVHFGLLLVVSSLPKGWEIPVTDALRFLAPLFALVRVLIQLFLQVHRAFFSFVNLAFGIAAIGLLIASYRSTRLPRLRNQLRVIGFGLDACLLLYATGQLIPTLVALRIDDATRAALTAGALLVGSGAIAYSIVRYKFLDAKLLARRGILYGAASAALVGLYLLIVVQIERLLIGFSGIDRRVIEPVFLVFAVIVFQPLMGRVEELLDRMFQRDPGDYRSVLRSLGRELMSTLELDAMLERSIRTIAEAMLLKRAYIAALLRDGVLVRAGAGRELAAEEQERLRQLLRRLPARDEVVRLDVGDGMDEEDRAFLVGHVGAALLVPLRTRGETVGALLLGDKVAGIQFTSEDVSLLSTLAGQTAVSLQNALLVRDRVGMVRIEEELRVAREIQSSFLLSEFPAMARFQVHALNIPSKEVGGDFYDLVSADDDSFVIAIADVAGKGVPAALLSSMLQASLRTQAASIRSVGEMLRNMNSLVYRGTAVHQFATFFLARIEPNGLAMTFSNAGHNYPIVARRGGEHVLLERGGFILGIVEQTDYEEGTVSLETGDRVVLYTDGITEATNGGEELFGEERLLDLVRGLPRELSAREVAERILKALRSFLGGVEPRDDMTLLVLQVVEQEPAALDTWDAIPMESAASRV